MTVSAVTTDPSAGSATSASDVAWHALTPDEVASRSEGRSGRRPDVGRGRRTTLDLRQEHLRRGQEGLALADVLPPVRGPDADRAADRGRRLPVPARAVLHGCLPDPADPLQRLDGHEPGGQGGGERLGAPEHDGGQREGPSERRARAEIPMEELVPGDIVNIEAGDLVPADARILSAATLEIDESALTGESVPTPKQVDAVAARRRPRRPRGHGLHELPGDPRSRHDPRHDDGHGHRGRPHQRHAAGHHGREDPADQAAGRAHQPDPRHRRHRARGLARCSACTATCSWRSSS